MSASRLCETCTSQLVNFYRFGFCGRAPTARIQSSQLRSRRIANLQKRTFTARSRARQPTSHPTEDKSAQDQIAHTVTRTRRTFGETLPEGFLSAKEYRVYERLYGPPAAVTNPQDVGLLQGLVQSEEVSTSTGQNAIFREDDEGHLEQVEYAPKYAAGTEDKEKDTETPMEEESGFSNPVDELQRTVENDFDQRFATYRDKVAASGEMNRRADVEEDFLMDSGSSSMEEGISEDFEEEIESQNEADEDAEVFDDPLNAHADNNRSRHHPLTTAGKWGPTPMTIQLPRDTFVDPISAILSEAANKHLTEVAQKVFGGRALPNSTATPLPKTVGETLKQSPIALEASQSSMGEMEANSYLAAIMPGAYASLFATLVEVRKRLGSSWLQGLLEKEAGPRVLDAGAGGAGVLAWRELLRNEWKLMHPGTNLGDQRIPFGKSTVVTGSSSLRQRASTLLDNTTFLPRLPDYNPSLDHPSLEKGKGPQRKQYDVILAPYTLWTLQEDHMRKTQIQNLWSLLNPDGGVLIVLEKGVPRGFELVAGAREVLLKFHIASQSNTDFENGIEEPLEGRYRDKEAGMIIAPCTNHGKCPMYLFSGKTVGRRDYCHFIQRYIRPPFLQRILGQNHRNHEDIRYSFVAVQRGVDLRRTHNIKQGQEAEDAAFAGYGQEKTCLSAANEESGGKSESPSVIDPLSFPRIILAPLKNRGHIIFDACTPAGKLERWTVPRSFSKQAYTDARKARWGDLWALGAKTRIPRRLKIGREPITPRTRRRIQVDINKSENIHEIGGTSKGSKRTKKPKHKNQVSDDDIDT